MGRGGLFDHAADLAAQVALAFAFDARSIRGRQIRPRQRKNRRKERQGLSQTQNLACSPSCCIPHPK